MVSISTTKKAWSRCLLLCALVFGLGGMQNARASHFAAGDIQVDYIGTSTAPGNLLYRVTLHTYASCEPGATTLYTTETIYWNSSCTNQLHSRTLTIQPGASGTLTGGDTVDQLCPPQSLMNSCRSPGSPYPGLATGTFTDTLSLPVACTDWKVYWEDGSRNGAILNLAGASGTSIHLEAQLDNTGTHWNNSTPRYNVRPYPFLCINQDDQFVNGPYDPDVDSLVTINWQPQNTGGTPIAYSGGGFSLNNPFNSAINYTGYPNPYVVNQITGTSYFHPTQQGKYVIAFRTYDYDKYTGALIGYTSRDVQVNILPCNTAPPVIDTGVIVNSIGTPQNNFTVCPGVPITFTVHGTSTTTTADLVMSSNNQLTAIGSNVTFANQYTAAVNGTFTWTPTGNDIGPHVVLFTLKDSTCNNSQPILLANYLLVTINVLPGIDAGPDGHYCPGSAISSLPWQLHVTGPPGIGYVWSAISGNTTAPYNLTCNGCPNALISPDPLASPTVTTAYVVTSNAPQVACKNKDTVIVTVTPAVNISAGPEHDICANQDVYLQPTLSPAAGNHFTWSPGATLSDSTILAPIASPTMSTYYVLRDTDAVGCRYIDSTLVKVTGVAPRVSAVSDKDTVCPGGSVNLSTTLALQACGLAQTACIGGTAIDATVGIDNNTSSYPSPFSNQQAGVGDRTQYIYTRADLEAAGMKAGYINSLAFNIAAKGSTDSFRNFTIKMACTNANAISYNTANSFTVYPNMAVVYNQTMLTHLGWNVWNFPVAYYWDGISNIAVEVCYKKVYGTNAGGSDVVYATNTPYQSVLFAQATGGSAASNAAGACAFGGTNLPVSNVRPNTRFNLCASTNYTYTWSPGTDFTPIDGPNVTATNITQNTAFIVTVVSSTNTACQGKDTVYVGVDNSNSIKATVPDLQLVDGEYILCRPDYVHLNSVAAGLPPIQPLYCGTNNTVNCPNPDSATVNPSIVSLNPNYDGSTPFYTYYATSRNQYIVRKEDMKAAGQVSGTLQSIAFYVLPGNTTFPTLNNLSIAVGCTQKVGFQSTNDFINGLAAVYTNTAYVVTPGWNTFTFTAPYNWDTSQNLAVQVCITNPTGTTSNVTMGEVSTGYTASIRGYAIAGSSACGGNVSNSTSTNNIPSMRFKYCTAPDAPFAYLWSPGQYVEDSTMDNTRAYIPQTVTYHVSTIGRNGCPVSDSVKIFIPSQHVDVNPKDTSICVGQSVRLYATGGETYTWLENGNTPVMLSCSDCANPTATLRDTGDYTYSVIFGNNGGICSDTVSIHLHAWPLPVVHIANNDTTIKFGQHVQLMVNDNSTGHGAAFYTWTPTGTLSDPNIPNPVASPTENTTYVLFGDDGHHCRNTDTVSVNIDYRDNLMVPTGFTPGAAINNRFHVVNLTFQKIMEFRVFNRWGQEIFSAKDNNGWDGTWKGVQQDMGAYQFLIRVGFPDGYVETYKGDVTLIR